MAKSDKTAGVLLAALFGYGLYMAAGFPERSSYFPMFICIAGLALSMLLIAGAYIKEKKHKEEEPVQIAPAQKKKLVLMGIMIVLYAAGMGFIGFTVSTIVFMIAGSLMLYPGTITKENKKPLVVIVVSSAVISVLILVVFKRLLYVPLPSGVLF